MAADSSADIDVVFKAAAVILAVHTADPEGFCTGCGAVGWQVDATDCPQTLWAVRVLDRYRGPTAALAAAVADPEQVFPDGVTFPLVGRLATSRWRRAYLFEGQWGTPEQQAAWSNQTARSEALLADPARPTGGPVRRAETRVAERRAAGSSAAVGRPVGSLSPRRSPKGPATGASESGTEEGRG